MPVSIRLGEELEERLARASKRLRVAKSEVIKRSLAAFLDQIEPGKGALAIHPITSENLSEIELVIKRYADRDIDFADATLIWLASLINRAEVMTIDRSDFEVYRLANGKPFTLLLA